MSSIIRVKRSSVPGKIPTLEQLDYGELAINTYDGRVFSKKNNGTENIFEISKQIRISEFFSNTSSDQIFDLFSTNDYTTAKYLITMTKNADIHTTEILLMHDGTNTYMTEYATLMNNSSLGEFSSDISDGNVRLLFSPTEADINVKSLKMHIDV